MSVQKGGKIHFNLDGLKNIGDLVWGKRVFGSYTDFELRTIVTNEQFFKNTKFYENGKEVTQERLIELGIMLQKPK